MLYEEGNALDTLDRAQGYLQCVLVNNTEWKQKFGTLKS